MVAAATDLAVAVVVDLVDLAGDLLAAVELPAVGSVAKSCSNFR